MFSYSLSLEKCREIDRIEERDDDESKLRNHRYRSVECDFMGMEEVLHRDDIDILHTDDHRYDHESMVE